MDLQLAITCLLVVTALASYLNHRFFKFPNSVGFTLLPLLLSLVIIVAEKCHTPFDASLLPLFNLVNLNASFINPDFFISVVCFLLFAGGLHIDVIELAKQKSLIAVLTTIGIIISTAIIGVLLWYVSNLLHAGLSLPYCLVFGALISPTDPIAVISMLKHTRAPKTLTLRITGESLFNDGIGVVVFTSLMRIAKGHDITQLTVLGLLAKETFGGILLGLVLGFAGKSLLKQVHEFHVALLISLSAVMLGYVTSSHWHVSAPISLAITGLSMGYKLRESGLNPVTAKQLQELWDIIDEVLNAILFVVIGFVVLNLTITTETMLLASLAIPIVLLARLVSVAIPIKAFSSFYQYSPYVIPIMTWGGLRGGISLALALSLPSGPEKQLILTTTYAVVMFSIFIQGMTIQPLINKSIKIMEQQLEDEKTQALLEANKPNTV